MVDNPSEQNIVGRQKEARRQDDKHVHCNVPAEAVEIVAEPQAESEADALAVCADHEDEEVEGLVAELVWSVRVVLISCSVLLKPGMAPAPLTPTRFRTGTHETCKSAHKRNTARPQWR
jgi:hypothetical protein